MQAKFRKKAEAAERKREQARVAKSKLDGLGDLEEIEKKKRDVLVQQKQKIVTELEIIRHALMDNGQDPDAFAEAYAGTKETSVSVHHGLLFAGKSKGFTSYGIEKIRLLFDQFDIDKDGQLSYLEFRGYLEALRRLEEVCVLPWPPRSI
jgi:hypothetical protein